ncbi:MAG: IS200/IS605 family element RNA-guided endonuclease TnpB [Synergistaceae bacterium]
METILKAYKYRMYPNKQQEILLLKHFGCTRWLYNYALDKKIKAYKQENKNLSRFEIQKDLPMLKKSKETEWLKEINSQSLQAALEHLDNAYRKFFKEKAGFPKFKSKHDNRQSFSVPQSVYVDCEGASVSIPKFDNIKIVIDRQIDGKIKSATVSKTPTGKYFISILVDTGLKIPEKPEVKIETSVGIDLGIKDFAVLSNGKKIENHKFLKKNIHRLKKLQKRASKKVKGSNNRKKANRRVARQHEKITYARTDFLHKLSTKMIRENQTICLEDLNVKGMMQNHKLSQCIGDAGWSSFMSMLQYKSDWYGKNLLTIGRFDPSSKMCSKCGTIKGDLTLKDRKWACSCCGAIHSRDYNASINIRDFALKQFIGVECSDYKPVESSTLVGSVKQETQPSLVVG